MTRSETENDKMLQDHISLEAEGLTAFSLEFDEGLESLFNNNYEYNIRDELLASRNDIICPFFFQEENEGPKYLPKILENEEYFVSFSDWTKWSNWGQDLAGEKPLNRSIEERAFSFIQLGKSNKSSRCIIRHMTDLPQVGSGNNHPLSGDDFGVCFWLLKTCPEWCGRMHEMAVVSDEWAKLVPYWSEMTSIYGARLAEEPPTYGPVVSDTILAALRKKRERAVTDFMQSKKIWCLLKKPAPDEKTPASSNS